MADKGWTGRVATAAGAAAGTGAAQLGLGYGLGVVVWPTAPAADDSAWLGSLGWATWIAASATVLGAVIAGRVHSVPGVRLRGPWRFALAASAAVGALVAVALIALPARSAVRSDTFSPQVIAAGYAVLGIVLGLIVAYWAVVSRPVAANLIGTAVWLWALAIAAVVVELAVHRESATYLTSWQFTEAAAGDRYGMIFLPSALLTLAAAFLIGIAAATPAAFRGDLGSGAATSGAVGPLLVAASFLALAPRLTGALGPLESAYLIAPYAVLAGLAGSALTVAAGRSAANRRARKAAARSEDATTADGRSEAGGQAEAAGRLEGEGRSGTADMADGRDSAANRRARKAAGGPGAAGTANGPDSVAATSETASPAGIAAVPAADPDTIAAVSAAPAKSKVSAPVPPQAARPNSVELEITVPQAAPAEPGRAGRPPVAPPAAKASPRPAGTGVESGKETPPAATGGAAPRGKSTGAAVSADASAERPAARTAKRDSADPEIAAAARPRPARPKAPAPKNGGAKGANGGETGSAGKPATGRGTITPPPSNPAVARINPEPEADK